MGRKSVSTVDPPILIPLISGLTNSGCIGKAAVKGVIYNQEKTYSGLENQRQYWGEAVDGGAVFGGGGCIF